MRRRGVPLVWQGLGVAVLILAADQASKAWLLAVMRANDLEPIPLAPFFNLVMVWNRGVSFGMFASNLELVRWGLVALSVVVSIALVFWLRRVTSAWLAVALGLVIGGAVANAIDRILHGAVADFFDFYLAAIGHWPAFNLADSAIVVGVAILLLDSLFAGRQSNT